MNVLREISYLLGLAANYIILALLFQSIFRKKNGTIILGVGFIVMVGVRWLLISQVGLPPYYASAFAIVIPCLVLCFFLSSYHDGRFFFTYFLAVNTYLVIRIFASMAEVLLPLPIAGVWVELLVKLILLGAVIFLFRKNVPLYRDALLEDAGWTALGVESVFAAGLLIKLIADLDRFEDRTSFYPDLFLYCVLLLFAYAVIIRIIKIQRDKKMLISDALKASEEAGLAKTEFLSRMSHEIRTPLNAIIGLAELGKVNLTSSQPNREEGLDYVNKTLDSSHYLLSLINDILDMSKIENNEIKLVMGPMDCVHVLGSIRTIIGTQAEAKHIRFEIDQRSNCPERVVGDATRVEQVLVNLLNNAVKFTPEGGQVRLTIERISKTEDAVTMRFQVLDTGVGISPEFLPRVFEPFAQEYAGITSSYGGSGLGLSIARQLTRMMNGDLTVESKKGEGSVFTAVMEFALPDEDCSAEIVSTCDSRRETDLHGLKILVCEDHPLNILVIQRLLEQKGCIVSVAENGRLGVDAFCKSADGFYDAVLMDIRMPEMDGLSAARAIRELNRSDAKTVPILAMTANAYAEDIRLSLEAGMNAHLSKPIEPQKLYETLLELTMGSGETGGMVR